MTLAQKYFYFEWDRLSEDARHTPMMFEMVLLLSFFCSLRSVIIYIVFIVFFLRFSSCCCCIVVVVNCLVVVVHRIRRVFPFLPLYLSHAREDCLSNDCREDGTPNVDEISPLGVECPDEHVRVINETRRKKRTIQRPAQHFESIENKTEKKTILHKIRIFRRQFGSKHLVGSLKRHCCLVDLLNVVWICASCIRTEAILNLTESFGKIDN